MLPEGGKRNINFEIYNIIGKTLSDGIDKAYRKGIASIVKLNKKEILRLADEPELFKISYTDTDKIALTNFKIEAFTVAGVMSFELEEKLRQLALDLQEGKHPLAKGEKDIKKIWVAEAYNIMADYIPIPDMPPPRYLNTNLRTAMQSSYHAAQYIRLQDDSIKNLYPAYQYKTLEDNRVREEHARLNNNIWRNDDPVWDKIWPPNGWNCRCYIKPLNEDERNNSAVQPKTSSDEQLNSIVGEGRIGKDFQRNSGKSRSIWGKWKDAKFKDLDYNTKFKESFEYARSISKKQVTDLLQSELEKYATPVIEREPTQENWDEDFQNNRVDTPIGEGVLATNALQKILEKRDNRKKYYGTFKTTLNDPVFIIKDERGGIVFVRAFMYGDKQVEIFAIGFIEGKLVNFKSLGIRNMDALIRKIKNGEVLHLKSTAIGNFAELPRKHFPVGSDLLNFNTKINFSLEIRNIKIVVDTLNENHLKNIMSTANEVWGETYNYNNVVNSEVYFIRYRFDGFQIVKINNNEAYEFKFIGYDKIDEFRKGVVLL